MNQDCSRISALIVLGFCIVSVACDYEGPRVSESVEIAGFVAGGTLHAATVDSVNGVIAAMPGTLSVRDNGRYEMKFDPKLQSMVIAVSRSDKPVAVSVCGVVEDVVKPYLDSPSISGYTWHLRFKLDETVDIGEYKGVCRVLFWFDNHNIAWGHLSKGSKVKFDFDRDAELVHFGSVRQDQEVLGWGSLR